MTIILVTGGTGFIGCYVMESLLRANEEVVTISRSGEPSRPLNVQGKLTVVKGDVTDKELLVKLVKEKGVSHVIHLGGILSWNSQQNPYLSTVINCIGTANVLEAARLADVRRIVFSSSVAVYGLVKPEPGKVVSEDHPANPSSVYGAAKFFGEKLGMNYKKIYGLDFIAVRIAAAYGYGNIMGYKQPSEHRVERTQRIVEFTLVGKAVMDPRGAFDGTDYVYVEDVANSIVNAAFRKNLRYQVYNLSSGEHHYMNDFAETVKRHVKGAEVTLGKETDPMYPPSGPYETKRAREDLGHNPRPFFKGVEDYIRVARAAILGSKACLGV